MAVVQSHTIKQPIGDNQTDIGTIQINLDQSQTIIFKLHVQYLNKSYNYFCQNCGTFPLKKHLNHET